MKHTACRNGKGNSLFGCLYTVKVLNANRLRRFKGVLILHMAGYDLGFDLAGFFPRITASTGYAFSRSTFVIVI